MLEILPGGGSVFYAVAKDGPPAPWWGVTMSKLSVPDLLRNTAQTLEIIHETNPKQFPELFGETVDE